MNTILKQALIGFCATVVGFCTAAASTANAGEKANVKPGAASKKDTKRVRAETREELSVGELRDHVKLLQTDWAVVRKVTSNRLAKLRELGRAAGELRAMALDTTFAEETDRTDALRLLSEVVDALNQLAKDRTLEDRVTELLGDCVTALGEARDAKQTEKPRVGWRS